MQMVEMHHVVLNHLRRHDQIAQQARVRWWHRANRILHCADRRNGVHSGAHTANPLGERPGVPRIPALEDDLHAPEHRGGGPGIPHHTAVDLRFDAQVTFDARDRIDNDVAHD
jgi:hypothetical protein